MQNKFAVITMIMILMIGMTGLGAATTVSIGDGNGVVTIPIEIDEVTNLGYCSMKLSFNPDLVRVTNVAGVDMNLISVSNWDAANGNVHITAFNDGDVGLDGFVTVADVTFEPAEPCSMGICPLSLINTLLLEDAGGLSGTPIDHDAASGEYTTTMVNGDASGDRVVDDFDVLYIAKYVMDPSGWPIACPVVADVNDACTGTVCVTLSDAAYLANYLAGDPAYDPLL